jgi:hypothetical protein
MPEDYMPNGAPVDKMDVPIAAQDNPRRIIHNVNLLQIVTAVSLLALCLMATVGGIFGILEVHSVLGGDANLDFVEYWASGQLLVHGRNPYDATEILGLERSAGYTLQKAQIGASPPTIFAFEAPLGFLGAKIGMILWTTLLTACLVASIYLLWIQFGRRSGYLHLLCFCCASSVFCLMAGQIGIFLLLTIALFLYLHKSNPFLSGAVLAVLSLKPHLFLPFGTILVLWSIHGRRYRILVGFASAIVAACALIFCIDAHAWSQYLQMMRIAKLSDYPVFTLSRTFRILLNRELAWLQYVPVVAGMGWTAWYFWRSRRHWNWMRHGLLVLIVSVVCAPYSWHTDETILIPAIMAGLYRSQETNRSLLPFALIAGAEFAELFNGFWMNTPYYLWTGPAWMAWFLYATRKTKSERLQEEAVLP